MIKILDCTLRDGGYYTNWDFHIETVSTYLEAIDQLPIDYVEIGYRSVRKSGYLGEFFYLPEHILQKIKAKTSKKLVIILNEKDTRVEDVETLLEPCKGIIDLVRLAIDPNNFQRAIGLAKKIKTLGFDVGFNVMYMSKWKDNTKFLTLLPKVHGVADYFYMVDSYGGVYPEDVKEITGLVKSYLSKVKIGFHGHNNLELAFINTLTAIEEGCSIVDATVTGMGRGAGNLKTEVLLTALNSKKNLPVDFNALAKVVDEFSLLQLKYQWGTNLPYMVSGANSLPQKEVMDWVVSGIYSYNSIIRALQNRASGIEDNKSLPIFHYPDKVQKVLLIGGGPSVKRHEEVLGLYIRQNPDLVLLHASSKNADYFKDFPNRQIFCLVGNEGYRMEEVFRGGYNEKSTICVLPPFPREMGTYIPEALENRAFELKAYSVHDKDLDSHTSIALQVIHDLNVPEVKVIGYDGYKGTMIDEKSQRLLEENAGLFEAFGELHEATLVSLTDTVYNIPCVSIYSLV